MANGSSPARKLPAHEGREGSSPKLREHKGGKGLKKVKKRLRVFSIRLGMDMTFLFLVCTLVIIGVIMMYSASYPSALAYLDNSQNYLVRQSILALIGFTVMMLVSYFD